MSGERGGTRRAGVFFMKKFLKAVVILLLIALVIYYLCKEGIIDVDKLKEKFSSCCGKFCGCKGSDDTIFEEE